ncbi:MAG: hypothetical protein ACREV9_09925 [Burkholderiales bacterium]
MKHALGILFTALAIVFAPVALAKELKTIAVLDFGLIDDTGETAKEEAQQKRLQMVGD